MHGELLLMSDYEQGQCNFCQFFFSERSAEKHTIYFHIQLMLFIAFMSWQLENELCYAMQIGVFTNWTKFTNNTSIAIRVFTT